ncbi:hypothetical protein SDC9_125115 [bioreactor metagenome]|uniref:Uncharacterized protein n=1 Tax=bioreactor metagenome TaxID=1076179 RepID=A0A645CMJ0_9ZZZZ
MVGDHADGHVGLVVLPIGLARNFFNMVQNGAHGIHFKQVAHALQHTGKALKAHTGVDVRVLQQCVGALAVRIELAEHKVPHFHIAVTVAAHFAVRLAATEFRPAVKINFAARAARAGAMLPKIILFAQAHHMFR